MSFDPVRVFIDQESAFSRRRGTIPHAGIMKGGQYLLPPSQPAPATTWGDVAVFGSSFMEWTDPRSCMPEGTSALLRYDLAPDPGCVQRKSFVRTAQFERAKKDWQDFQPLTLLTKQYGLAGAATELVKRRDQVFPFNEWFWGLGRRYAIERSAAGFIDSRFKIAIDSLVWATRTAPGRVAGWAGDFAGAMKDALDAIPRPATIVTFLKWGSVGIVALYAYRIIRR